jgi:23S rRNA (cytosine1962-C5)-methyltransferase
VVGDPADGAEVDLYSSAGHFIARGLFNARSKIRVRLYCWQPGQALDHAFFAAACDRALRLRRDLLRLTGPESACRLIFSEGDGLSGMTVDQYGQWLCVQFTALGLAQRRDLIAQVLAEVVQPRGIYLRTERGIGSLEGLQVRDGLLWGEPPPDDLTIREGPLLFRVNLREGQKTVVYLDNATTANWWPAWRWVGACWMRFAIRGALACTPPLRGPSPSSVSIRPPPPWNWPGSTPNSTG